MLSDQIQTAQAEHAKRCIQTLEQIRRYLYRLSNMVTELRPDASQKFGTWADELKDWRELLEEFIPYDYDEGK